MCGICDRIEQTKAGKNPYFVRELETGYVVIGDYQRFEGYSLFLCKVCADELHQLEDNFREAFLKEMTIVAEAVYLAFKPDKLNYELLGSGVNTHMHWHFFPRRKGDTSAPGPVWRVNDMNDEKYRPSPQKLEAMKQALDAALQSLLP